MQCLWVAVNDELEADTHDGHLRENKSGLYITSDCCVTLCFSVRADSSSQNPKGNNSGKNHGFLYQNVGNDKREEPLHTEGKARCTINDNTAHHVLFITKKKLIYFTWISRFIRGAPTRSANWTSTDIREQTTGAALVQNSNTGHFVSIYMQSNRLYQIYII